MDANINVEKNVIDHVIRNLQKKNNNNRKTHKT